MFKYEIGECCRDCETFSVEGTDRKQDHVLGCIRRNFCKRYLAEPIKALPAEELFREATHEKQ